MSAQGDSYRLSAAGDTFNTAVYLARSGIPTEYLTCLGDDPVSSTLLASLAEEGIAADRIKTLPGRSAGIYLVSNEPDGERHFTYWREQSAARSLFEEPIELPGVSGFYFSGITLAIARNGIENLLHLLASLSESSCAIYFDPNYRPALWDDANQAREIVRRVLPFCNAVFPTLEDERLLWGVDSVESCRDFYGQEGIGEIVVKAPDLTAHAWMSDEYVCRQAARVQPLDTTGAGDAFNAGYLSVRLTGGDVESALGAAQALSALVVQHQGAILPRQPAASSPV